MTRHFTGEYVEAFQSLCMTGSNSITEHPEQGKSGMEWDGLDVQKIVELIEQKQNPFDQDSVPAELINISFLVKLPQKKWQKE